MSDIEKTLGQRGSSYGTYEDNASMFMRLQYCLKDGARWGSLPYTAKTTLIMIAMKMARIVNGGYVNSKDSWHDIVGYATLEEKEHAWRHPADDE